MEKKILVLVDFSLDNLFSGNRTLLFNYLNYLKSLHFEIHIHLIKTSRSIFVVGKEFRSLGLITLEYQFFTHLKRFFVSRFLLPFGINIPILFWKTSRCKLLGNSNYSIVLVNYVWNFDCFVKPNSLKILLAHDSFIDRNKRLKTNWVSFSRKDVVSSYRAFDKVLLSNYSEYLLEGKNSSNVDFVGLPFKKISERPQEIGENSWGFIGSNNALNLRTAEYIIGLFKSMNCHSKLYIAGAVCDSIKESDFPPNVVLLNSVKDLRDFYDKVHIVFSLRGSSSGIKVKELEAMAYGKIVICDRSSFDCFPTIDGMDPPFICYDDYRLEYPSGDIINNDYFLRYISEAEFKLNSLFCQV
jgi:hypothetical protein